jgi:hypothetical protein
MSKDFNDLELQGLRWVQVGGAWGWGRDFNLENSDGEVSGTLTRPRWWNHSYAEVDAPGNRWSFQREGFFNRRIVVKSLGTGNEIATYFYRMGKDKLVLLDGRTFYWKQTDFWGSKHAWLNEHDVPIVGFKAGGFLTFGGQINIDPGVIDMKSLGLLVFMGWYLILLQRSDSSSTAAATVSFG